MKLFVVLAACVALSGCAGMPTAGATNTDVIGAIKEIASDPRCGHTDRLQGNLGGLGGNNLSLFLERTCPPATPAPAS